MQTTTKTSIPALALATALTLVATSAATLSAQPVPDPYGPPPVAATPVTGVGVSAGSSHSGARTGVDVGRASGVGAGVTKGGAAVGAGVGNVVGGGVDAGNGGVGVNVGVAGMNLGVGVGGGRPLISAGQAPPSYVPGTPVDPSYKGVAAGVGVGPAGIQPTAGVVRGDMPTLGVVYPYATVKPTKIKKGYRIVNDYATDPNTGQQVVTGWHFVKDTLKKKPSKN